MCLYIHVCMCACVRMCVYVPFFDLKIYHLRKYDKKTKIYIKILELGLGLGLRLGLGLELQYNVI